MTEYNASPEAIEEFLSAKERTAYWVSSHDPSVFVSPSIPPSVLDDPDAPPYEPSESDAESTHSLPPKMVLKYNDGRPDVPISHWHYDGQVGGQRRGAVPSGSRPSQHPSAHGRSKSSSHAEYVSSRHSTVPASSQHNSRPPVLGPSQPEEIRILPSQKPEVTPSANSQSYHSRSLPQSRSPEPVPPPARQSTASQAPSYVFVPSQVAPSTVAYSHSQPVPLQYYPRGRPPFGPPAIVYAPGNHSRSNYAPPAMIYSHNPPAMKHSQSAPNPSKYTQPSAAGSHYAMPVNGTHTRLASVQEESRSRRGRSGSPGGARSLATSQREPSRTPSHAVSGSGESGSTYYVIPSPGQKVQIVVPDGARSIYTATSTTKAPSSPYSGSSKRPFFQRLFSFGDKAFDTKSTRGRKLHRRHSTGATGRVRPPSADKQAA